VSLTDINGVVTQLNYDSRNRLLQSNTNGRIQKYQYNQQNQLILYIDELGRETHLSYNPYNELSQVLYPSGDELTLSYNYQSTATVVTRRWLNADGSQTSQTIRQYNPRSGRILHDYLNTTSLVVSQQQYNATPTGLLSVITVF